VIVVVGGTSRKSGKTSAVCEIIAATTQANWIAVKITPHEHGASLETPIVIRETTSGGQSDTARFLQAGARQAWWVRASPRQISDAMRGIPEGNRIVESNAAAAALPADLFFFVIDPNADEWKLSARHIDRADLILSSSRTSIAISMVQAKL
jgi:hypothetical protein